jgi:YD repeat-containing protein
MSKSRWLAVVHPRAGALVAPVFCAFIFLTAGQTTALAQTGPATDELGLQPNRQYVQLLPFERIDTATGNVLLTFSDMTLRGNNGWDLSFERGFNNQVSGPGALPWRFGIAGVPMRVVEKVRPTNSQNIVQTIVGERQWAPYFELVDGSRAETTFVQTPDSKKAATQQWVQTSAFWRFDRTARNLHLPDGRVAHYTGTGAAAGVLDRITDPFGNVVVLNRTPNHLQVMQSLGPGGTAPFRTIEIDMNDATGLPTALTFGARTWTYIYDMTVAGRLLEVQPPLDQPWLFEYETGPDGKLSQVTTPQGGTVSYTYLDQPFVDGPSTTRLVNVLNTRTTGGRVNPGTWTFTFAVGGSDSGLTTVAYPVSGSVTYTYQYQGVVLAGTWAMTDRAATATGASSAAETEHRDYVAVPAGRASNTYAVPEMSLSRITRNGRDYTTTFGYSAANFGDFHHPSTITETGELSRTTQLEYVHVVVPTAARHLLALPSRELTTVSGQTVQKTWVHNTSTGFRTSQTVFGITTTFTPDPSGNLATAVKANGKSTNFVYTHGQVSSWSSPGLSVSRSILLDGTVSSETVAGRRTDYNYDLLFRVVRTAPPGGANPTIVSYSNIDVQTTRGPSSTTADLDGFGRVIATRDSVGRRTQTDYDGEGRRIYQSDRYTTVDKGTSYSYDVLGRVTQESNPGSTSRTYFYSADAVTVHDEKGRSTEHRRQAFGDPDDARLSGFRDARGTLWSYAYNAIGLLTSVSGGGASRTWSYVSGFPTLVSSESHPESGTTTYAYDSAGILTSKIDARGTTFSYARDGSDRMVRETAGTEVTTFAYEAGSNNPVLRKGSTSSSVFNYDDAGRWSTRSDIDASALSIGLTYDSNGNVTEIKYPSGRRIGYAYDSEDRITRVFDTATQQDYASGFSYHPSGGVLEYTTANGLTTTIDYHPDRDWVTRIRVGELDLTYEHDEVGNVSAVLDSRPGMNAAFTHDELDRLTGVSGTTYPTMAFAYDALGNRATAFGTTYTYGPGFRLASVNGLNMTYDANGNMLTGPQATFTYSAHNLLKASTVAGVTATYAYDDGDWRTKKIVEGGPPTYYVRGPGNLLLTEWSNATPNAHVKDYIYAGSRLLAVIAVDLPTR